MRGCTRPKLLAMLTMPISYSFLHGYGAPLGDPLRRRSSPIKLVRLFRSPFLPACSVQQSIPFLILSMSILANTLPTMDSRVNLCLASSCIHSASLMINPHFQLTRILSCSHIFFNSCESSMSAFNNRPFSKMAAENSNTLE